MYPQTVVPSGDNLHTTLTNGMDVAASGVTFTGDYYTANKDNLAWSEGTYEENKVYEYDNKRYVRVTPWAFLGYSSTDKYNDGEIIGQHSWNNNSYRWFKIEPIKWIILNFNQLIVKNNSGIVTDLPELNKEVPMELYAADVLMSGIRIGSNSLWSTSDINKYLNSKFHDEAFSTAEANMIQVSTIYNNTSSGDYNNPSYNLNSNHLQSGGMNPTNQKIYLLSYYELSNTGSPYVTTNPIFEDNGAAASTTRQVSGTDYARAHYLWLPESGNTIYWTRTTVNETQIFRVNSNGAFGILNAFDVHYGTRPALQLN